jgi:transposase-like zinc-binding protein
MPCISGGRAARDERDHGNCRTAAVGGPVEACDDCGVKRIVYHSCRNCHCPKCRGQVRAKWVAGRPPSRTLAPSGLIHSANQTLIMRAGIVVNVTLYEARIPAARTKSPATQRKSLGSRA